MLMSMARQIIRSLTTRSGAAPARRASRASQPVDLMQPLEGRQMLAATIVEGQALQDRMVAINGGPVVVGLTGRYLNDLSAVTGSIVYFDFVGFGRVFVELFDALPASADANRTVVTDQLVSNFLSYVNSTNFNKNYEDSIVHRSIPGFIVQGGGFKRPDFNNQIPEEITTNPPVDNQPGNKNKRGTLAFAQLGTDPDSATSQWFFNLADNAGLDTQSQSGGPYSVFGKVLGRGMENVIDQIALVQRFNLNAFYGGEVAFKDTPLRNFSSAPVKPQNFVTLSNIVEDETQSAVSAITYTARSSNSGLATPSVDQNGNLILNLGTNKAGSCTITVRATAADGSFVEDTFVLNVLGTPLVGTLKVEPKVLGNPGSNFKLSAGGVTGRGATITKVEFFVDGDGNGLFDENEDVLLGEDTNSSGGFTLTFPTTFEGTPWDPGTYAFFARATDSAGQFSNIVTVDGRINELPEVNSFSGSPNPVARLTSINFTANVTDDTKVSSVEIFRDVNGDGEYQSNIDKRVGSARRQSGTDTWTLTASTKGFTVGDVTFFARGKDENSGFSLLGETVVTITNVAPELTAIKLSPTRLSDLGRLLTITASKIKDPDGSIAAFEAYYDTDDSGDLNLANDLFLASDTSSSGGFKVSVVAAALNGFVVGQNRLLLRAIDNNGASSAVVIALPVVNALPTNTTPLALTLDPISKSQKINGTIGVSDSDGTVKKVELIWSRTGGPGPQSGDKTLGSAKFDTLSGLFKFSNLSSSSLALGLQTFFVRITDNDGGVRVVTQQFNVVA